MSAKAGSSSSIWALSADEAVLHHQKRVDRLLHAGRAQRMAGQRFRGRDRRTLLPAPNTSRIASISFESPIGVEVRVRIDVVDRRLCTVAAPCRMQRTAPSPEAPPCRSRPRSRHSRRSRHRSWRRAPWRARIPPAPHARAAGDHEAVAVLVVGARGDRGRVVVARRHGAHGVEQHRQASSRAPRSRRRT